MDDEFRIIDTGAKSVNTPVQGRFPLNAKSSKTETRKTEVNKNDAKLIGRYADQFNNDGASHSEAHP